MPRTKLILISIAILSIFIALPAIACHRNDTPHGQDDECPDPILLFSSGEYCGQIMSDGEWTFATGTGVPAADVDCEITCPNQPSRVCSDSELLLSAARQLVLNGAYWLPMCYLKIIKHHKTNAITNDYMRSTHHY